MLSKVSLGSRMLGRVCQLPRGNSVTSRSFGWSSSVQVAQCRMLSPAVTQQIMVPPCSRVLSTRIIVACAADSSTIELEVKVEGMKCGGCSSRVEAALKAMDNVKDVQVDLESKMATVEVEAASQIDAMNMLPEFVKTIKELGFEAEPHIEYQL